MGMSEVTKKILARRASSIRHCPPKNFRLEGVTRFVMGMSEVTKKFLVRRACSISHCTPKKFSARRCYPIRHWYNYGVGKLFLELNTSHGYV